MFDKTIYLVTDDPECLLHSFSAEDYDIHTLHELGASSARDMPKKEIPTALPAVIHLLSPALTSVQEVLEGCISFTVNKKKLEEMKQRYFAEKLELAQYELNHVTAEAFQEDKSYAENVWDILSGEGGIFIRSVGKHYDTHQTFDDFLRDLTSGTYYLAKHAIYLNTD